MDIKPRYLNHKYLYKLLNTYHKAVKKYMPLNRSHTLLHCELRKIVPQIYSKVLLQTFVMYGMV